MGELLGGIADIAGPIRRIDSDSARDSVLGLKLSLLDERESREVAFITLSVSPSTESFMIHWCFNASEALILLFGSGWIILDMRSWAKCEICNSDGNSSDEIVHSLERELSSQADAVQLESPSEKSASSDLKNDVEEGGVPHSITYNVMPREYISTGVSYPNPK